MRAMITGILGQDGRHLASQLDALGYEVIGISRELSNVNSKNLSLYKCSEIISEDLSVPSHAKSILNQYKPEKIFHMAGVHASAASMLEFGKVAYQEMQNCHIEITRNILEWQRINTNTKSVIALSSQMYSPLGDVTEISEESSTSPSSKYVETKLEAFSLIKRYRKEHNCKSAGAILFNHTSDISKDQFLFPILASQLCEVLEGKRDEIQILNAEALIDMSAAEEVCAGMISMTEISPMGDIVFSSGNLESVRSIVEKTLVRLSISIPIKISSTSTNMRSGRVVLGNISRARDILNWVPKRTPADILYEMVKILRIERT
jgi:GDPmannose 4,6-dehydratase